MYDVLIIGGGAAGMTAAVFAAQRGADTAIIEKNDRLGRKLAITGKGRCNLTNNCPFEELFENIPRNPRFLYSAFAGFPPAEVMNFFTSLGVPLKTERGRRVFPVSDKAGDVVEALEKRLRQLGVTILKENARGLVIKDGKCVGARTNHGETPAKCVILASGGKSYPKTGSDGFGYELARRAGHTVIEPRASLSGLVCKDFRFADAAGLTLKNCAIKLFEGEKRLYEDFGELSFTENGLSGATVLSASAHIEDISRPHAVVVDLNPRLTRKSLTRGYIAILPN